MSSLLTEFLQEEGKRLQASRTERQAKRTEWQTAVRKLMTQLAEWVRTADPND